MHGTEICEVDEQRLHRCVDVVGMIMVQLSFKAAIKKWGRIAEQAITMEKE
jgi:hypothetical protein